MQSNANLLNERRYYCDNPIFEQYYEIFTHLGTLWRADSEVILNDGSKKVFLNADGKNGAVSEELKAFLDYVAGRPSEDTFVKKLKRAVEKAKKNREWRHEYMTLLMRDRENRKIGEKLGKIHEAISMGKDYNIPQNEILTRLQTKFDLTEEQARAYLEEAE